MAKGEDDRDHGSAKAAARQARTPRRRAPDPVQACGPQSDGVMASGQDNWNGARTVLAQTQYVNMPQTPNGSLILGYLNQAKQNNDGQIIISSGGNTPQVLPVPALIQMLSLNVNNWQANNLRVTNTSASAATPILVQAFGPGIPGAVPGPLPVGQTINLGVTQAAQGTSQPKSMLMRFRASTGNLSIVGIVGGPQTQPNSTNAYVIALNAPTGETGPPTDIVAPAGYYATTGLNSYDFPFNWSTSTVYIVNLSPIAAATMSAMMIAL